MLKSNFAAFILTHGRPNKVITWDTLKKAGYTGRIYLILDSQDKTVEEYRERFGAENVIVFDKADYVGTFDVGDSIQENRGVIYARNASFKIAKDLGLEYYVQLDDDYTDFLYRFVEDDVIKSTHIKSFDAVVNTILKFLDTTGAITVAMSQGGDHMGGVGGPIRKGILRKAMNSMFFRVDRPTTFIGRINEDVNAYVTHGAKGDLFLTVTNLQLNQVQTQKSSGGMTELYLDNGTYVKSFYSVVLAPSCVTVKTMGRTDRRYHHSVKWNNAVPMIISSKYKKTI
jgi:hypothetical protein